MAKQFTTFSVVDILGRGGSAAASTASYHIDGNVKVHTTAAQPLLQLQAIAQEPSTATTPGSHTAHAPRALGTVNQMLPPAPCSSASFHAQLPAEGSARPQRRSSSRKKGSRPTLRSRVRSEQEDLLRSQEEEDDVFYELSISSSALNAKTSRQTSARTRQPCAAPQPSPHDLNLNSAGATPSPPGDNAGAPIIKNNTEPSSRTESSGHTDSTTSSPTEEDEEEQPPKKKRARTAYSRQQLQTMERYFRKNVYPDNRLLNEISQAVGTKSSKVQVWFQNRRAKARKWGQVFEDPHNNAALHHGTLPQGTPHQSSPHQGTTHPHQGTTSHLTNPSLPILPPFPSTTPYSYYPYPTYPLAGGYPLMPPHLAPSFSFPYPPLTASQATPTTCGSHPGSSSNDSE